MTFDDLVALPEDRLRHEIFDGEHVTTPTPFTQHQRAVKNLLYCFGSYLEPHPIGEVLTYCNVIFAPDNVVVPDILYISDERSSILTETYINGAPDLLAEVTSDVTRYRDEVQKKAIYERFGVIEYWIADPEVNEIKIYRRGAPITLHGNDVLTSPLFPGLAIDVATLFR